MDVGYVYEEVQEIKDQKDIENLEWVSGGFHDARIAKEELLQDGTLYLRFDGTWGCEIEVWLSEEWILCIMKRTDMLFSVQCRKTIEMSVIL